MTHRLSGLFTGQAEVVATPIPADVEAVGRFVAVLRAVRDQKAAASAVPETKTNPALAEPYMDRRAGELVIDSQGRPGTLLARKAGVVSLTVGITFFILPGLWVAAADGNGWALTPVTVGIGLLLLIPTLIGLGLVTLGVELLGKRLRTTLSYGRVRVTKHSWLWCGSTAFEYAAIIGIRSATDLGVTTSDRTERVYSVLAKLQGGHEIELAWGIAGAEAAAAVTSQLQKMFGAGRNRGAITETSQRISRQRRPGPMLVTLILLPPAVWLALELSLRYPAWDGLDNDPQRLERLVTWTATPAILAEWVGEDKGLHWPPRWLNRRWMDAARSRLAAGRPVPAGAAVIDIPRSLQQPNIDGVIAAAEWQGSYQLQLQPESLGSMLYIGSDGARLYLAADVPGDTTTDGFDQFRLWFHLKLSPAFENERVFLDRGGGISVMRGLQAVQDGNKSRKPVTEHLHYRHAAGATRVAGHRQYELALDLEEMGIVPGVPFNLWIDIEGDPQRHPDGKFKARSILGTSGSYRAPLWLRITT